MRKIVKKIIGLFMKPDFKYSLALILMAVLLVVVFVISASSVDGLWKKIIATCYITATVSLFMIVGIPKALGNVGFGNISIISFITWCIIVPIIIGALVAMVITELMHIKSIANIGFWSMAICITSSSFVWFLTKLYKDEDYTSRLDLFSTVWIVIVTILITLYDLFEIRGAFVFLLAMYFIIQILIKARICKIQEHRFDES